MRVPTLLALFVVTAPPLCAQWTHRYAKVAGYSHHVYLEGYELPTLNQGPTDPAPSPDGSRVAFSARGWIWILDRRTGIASRLTSGGAMDFRPTWSADGRRLAFVRDDTRDTHIVVRDLESGAERRIDSPAMELDPVFAPDGAGLIFASASAGQFDLWRYDFATDERTRTSQRPGIELSPTVSADDRWLVYLHKGGGDRIVARDGRSGNESELVSERILSQMRPAVRPDGRTVVYGWATQEGYELRLVSIDDPSTTTVLTGGVRGLPLAPAWDPTGSWVWFAEADAEEVMHLYRIRAVGGAPEEVGVLAWDWGESTGTLRVRTTMAGQQVAARLGVVDADAHPLIPDVGRPTFGLQDGRVFFYSPGVVELSVPVGPVTVSAVRGLTTPEVDATVEVRAGELAEVTVQLDEVWNARAAGYLSGDHHFHLNYGGVYTLDPPDLLPMMAGENLDVATPLVANLHNRFEYQSMFGWERGGSPPLVRFGQEVRSHFLGHLGLLNTKTLFWPWIWGPGYQVYGGDDRPNADALQHAQREGGLAGYVHPSGADPFAPENVGSLPVLLTVDGVLGNMDWLEVACLWTDEVGTAEVWYRFLSLGIPIVLEAGTDVMNDFYRTMAIGTTRQYVYTGGATSFEAYWRAMREGRSFVTTGPMLQLTVDGAMPGDAVAGARTVGYELELASAVPVERIDLVVNGEVVLSEEGLAQPGRRAYRGRVDLPAGGWVAARAIGPPAGWPAMDSYAFAQTSPVWLGSVGSTDPAARSRAAADLTAALDAAQARLLQAYGGAEHATRIVALFAEARARLR